MGKIILSLFDGESGAMMAFNKAGIKIKSYYASEIEESAVNFSKNNFPEIIHIGDVTKIKYEKSILYTEKGEYYLPKIDILVGGSPCQGFSRQGLGLNFEDPRSILFFEFVRIMKEIKKENENLKFMLENVDMKKEWEDVITEYLEIQSIKINSELLLPHNRPRTYWTNLEIKKPKKLEYSLLDYLDEVELLDYTLIGDIKVCNSFSENSKKLILFENNEVRIKQAVKIGYAIAEKGDGINLSFPTSKTRRGRVTKNKIACLDTQCNVAVYDNKNQIRPLTINELCKMQGVEYTLFENYKEKDVKKMLGNGWTIDVISYIFKHLK